MADQSPRKCKLEGLAPLRRLVLFVFLTAPLAHAEAPVPIRIRPVCGNTESGIVAGRPKLFDDRTMALLVDSLESRLKRLDPGAGMLAERTQLNYQLTNLRSLSDRALSDRVLLLPSRGGSQALPRAQALVGFQVSLDPKDAYVNAVAEVEITITSKAGIRQPPALVALLPREKTFNAAMFSKEAAGAVQDTDTISMERLSPTREQVRGCATGYHEGERDITLAWQFKPVFGKDRVDPGARQVYALLALPTSASEEYLADVHVHTHWRTLKRPKHKNASDLIEDSMRDELWPDAIRYNPAEMEASLKPKINDLRFVPAGPGQVLVMADGDNFLADTSVMFGNVTQTGPSLSIQREKHLQFTAPAQSLTDNDLFLTGRFAVPVPLVDAHATQQQWTSDPAWGLKIEYARAHPKDSLQCEIRIKLKSRQRKKPLPEMIVNRTLVSAAGRVFPVTGVETEPTDSDALLIRFDAPTADVRASRQVTVARLFGGELYRDSAELVLEDDITATTVSLLAATQDDVMLAVSGSGFSSLAVVQIAGTAYTRWTKPALLVDGSTMLTLKVRRQALEGVKQLTVGQGFAQPLILPIPDLTPNEASRMKPRRKAPPK